MTILPYDYNRVVLTPKSGELTSDYINASYIGEFFLENRKTKVFFIVYPPTFVFDRKISRPWFDGRCLTTIDELSNHKILFFIFKNHFHILVPNLKFDRFCKNVGKSSHGLVISNHMQS